MCAGAALLQRIHTGGSGRRKIMVPALSAQSSNLRRRHSPPGGAPPARAWQEWSRDERDRRCGLDPAPAAPKLKKKKFSRRWGCQRWHSSKSPCMMMDSMQRQSPWAPNQHHRGRRHSAYMRSFSAPSHSPCPPSLLAAENTQHTPGVKGGISDQARRFVAPQVCSSGGNGVSKSLSGR